MFEPQIKEAFSNEASFSKLNRTNKKIIVDFLYAFMIYYYVTDLKVLKTLAPPFKVWVASHGPGILVNNPYLKLGACGIR